MGSEENQFRDLYVSSASIKLVDKSIALGDPRRITEFKKEDFDNLLKGKIPKRKDNAGADLSIKRIGDVDAVDIKSTGTGSFSKIIISGSTRQYQSSHLPVGLRWSGSVDGGSTEAQVDYNVFGSPNEMISVSGSLN